MKFVIRNDFGLPVYATSNLGEVGDFLGDAEHTRTDAASLKVDKSPDEMEFRRRVAVDCHLYDEGYDAGCKVRNRHLEPMPGGMPYSWRCGYSAGLADRGAYYRVNDL